MFLPVMEADLLLQTRACCNLKMAFVAAMVITQKNQIQKNLSEHTQKEIKPYYYPISTKEGRERQKCHKTYKNQ